MYSLILKCSHNHGHLVKGALKAIKCHNKAKDESRTQAETSNEGIIYCLLKASGSSYAVAVGPCILWVEACDRPAVGSDCQACNGILCIIIS